MVIESMASQGKEPTFCMGDDIPLAALSQKPHMIYDYFKQRFAQVLTYSYEDIHLILIVDFYAHLLTFHSASISYHFLSSNGSMIHVLFSTNLYKPYLP